MATSNIPTFQTILSAATTFLWNWHQLQPPSRGTGISCNHLPVELASAATTFLWNWCCKSLPVELASAATLQYSNPCCPNLFSSPPPPPPNKVTEPDEVAQSTPKECSSPVYLWKSASSSLWICSCVWPSWKPCSSSSPCWWCWRAGPCAAGPGWTYHAPHVPPAQSAQKGQVRRSESNTKLFSKGRNHHITIPKIMAKGFICKSTTKPIPPQSNINLSVPTITCVHDTVGKAGGLAK